MKANVRIRMGRQRPLPLRVPGEIFEIYQPLMGVQATLLWLNMCWLEHTQAHGDVEEALQERLHLSFAQLAEPLNELMRFGLLEIGADGEYILHEPLSAEAFAAHFNDQVGASLDTDKPAKTPKAPKVKKVALPPSPLPPPPPKEEPADDIDISIDVADEIATHGDSDEEAVAAVVVGKEAIKPWAGGPENISADMEAVMDLYHRKIGMAGPTQFDKLRFWVEEQGMEGEVVAAAIEETVQSAHTPRINYLEGVLRNWSNDGIRTLKDLVSKQASKVLSGSDIKSRGRAGQAAPSASMEGMANADAYRRVDPKMVKQWKELYPDEYDG